MDLPNDYRKILLKEFESRNLKNPSYSMRAFARDLSLAPSHLSQVLNKKYGLSLRCARSVGEILKWPHDQQNYFCDLVESVHARSAENKKKAKWRARKYIKEKKTYQINMDIFSMVSDWHHSAIVALTETSAFESDPKWIACALNISEEKASAAIDRLLRFGLLKRDTQNKDRLVASHSTSSVGDEIPSQAIRSFHKQILVKTSESLDANRVEEREVSNVIMAVSTSQLPTLKKALISMRNRFVAELDDEAEKKLKKNAVYGFGVYLIPLSKIIEEKDGTAK